jgi:hypothetical protein
VSSTPAISLSTPLPSVVRVNQELRVSGSVRHAPSPTRAVLEELQTGSWQVLAKVRLGKHERFALTWKVTGPAYRSLTLRVSALRHRKVIAATPSHTATVGPAAVYCSAPVPPAVNIPVGDGWIVGGLYGEGGAYPGVYQCISYAYTLTVTNSAGKVVATQQVAPKHSYTVVLPAGSYTLRGGCGSGSGTVTAGKQSDVNMYCLYP